MLIEFKFKNFLSYRDETSFVMTKVKSFKELNSKNVIKTSHFDLLKTGVVYGSNGGGKTNFIRAMSYMKSVIHNSYADSLKEDDKKIFKNYYFKLDDSSIESPSLFEVSFIIDDAIYRYGFEIKNREIISEWLTRKTNIETTLFEREGNRFKINKTSFKEGDKFVDSVNSNVLFLSYLAQNNGKISTKIFGWFVNVNAVSGLVNLHYKNVTKELIKRSKRFQDWLSVAVKFLGITSVSTDSNNDIITYHSKFDENNIIYDSVSFNLEKDESQGTVKLIYILGAIYDTLRNGKILFIDEFDSKLHPNLSKKLISFFHELNKNNAQFIFTAHDSVLLDKDIFRRDQIWFADRNKYSSSEIYSLSDFNSDTVRNTSDFRKKYLELNFGAAKSIEISKHLTDLLYE